MNIIQQAKKLIEDQGKEKAILHFKQKIEKIGKPKNFDEICTISGCEVAIEWINGDHRPEKIT